MLALSFCVSPQPASLQTCSRSISPRLSGPARPCGRGKLAQFSLLQRYAVWWVAPPWPILPVPAVLFWLFVGSLLKSRLDGKMGVKWPKKWGKMATFAGTCYVTIYDATPLLQCGCVNCRRKEHRETTSHNHLFIKNLRRKPGFPNFQKSPKT